MPRRGRVDLGHYGINTWDNIRCLYCGGRIPKGDPICWLTHTDGTMKHRHPDCYPPPPANEFQFDYE